MWNKSFGTLITFCEFQSHRTHRNCRPYVSSYSLLFKSVADAIFETVLWSFDRTSYTKRQHLSDLFEVILGLFHCSTQYLGTMQAMITKLSYIWSLDRTSSYIKRGSIFQTHSKSTVVVFHQ